MFDTGEQAADFMPHGHCIYWQADLLALHVGSDILIALAYFSIPFALLYLSKKRPDLGFSRVFMLFAVFILACGITHLLNGWNFWHADYWLSGFAKAITAVISIITAVLLWKWMPDAVRWPSPTLLKQSNEELLHEVELRHEKEQLLEEAFDNAPIGKALVALNGDWIKVNRALCHNLGYSTAEMMRMNFQTITHEDDLAESLNHVKDLIEGRSNAYQMEKRYRHKLGHIVWALLSVTIVRDVKKMPLYLIAQILDITYRKLAEEELRRMHSELEVRVQERTYELEIVNKELHKKNELLNELSTTDPLTQMNNRRSFDKKIEELIYDAQRYAYEFCVVIIDIDNFKLINDVYGHVKGDEVICCISRIMKNNIRKSDIAARIGGDEFVILMPHTSSKRAPDIAEILRKLISEAKFSVGSDNSFSVTCSMGIAEYEKSMSDGKMLLIKADEALYLAKQQGRNRVVVK